ncbi:MAG: TonB-dependent siderophore receptor [Aphanocapsa sp. GSE-SYN-MK-11-07L]|jgi:iron complex outermembrane receptor protein|nr:TonB-dependent siderophore receptor [Aphanocapsa sp. GSE-SYN-MK-11-07L]
MGKKQLSLIILVGAIASVNGQPSQAEPSIPSTDKQNTEIKQAIDLKDLSQPAVTVKDWLAQIETDTVQVIGVQLNPSATGLQIVLETQNSEFLTVDATQFRAEGNRLIADISNAVLSLPDAQSFKGETPTPEIATVQVTQLDASRIQIIVTGKDALPKSEVTLKAGELIYTLNPADEEADEEIIVTGQGQEGYFVPDSSTATRTDTPIRDIPASIQVIPRQVLEDQNVERLQDALQNVSGVTKRGNYGGGAAGGFVIRGFTQEGNFRNGLRDNNFYAFPEIANIERVEVLKGPASILFGQVEPGGIVNIVTKQPLSDPYYALEFTAGNYNFYRPSFDFSGPLNAEKTVLYRLNFAYQNSGSFRDFFSTERFFVAPALTWKIGQNTTLDIDFEYLRDKTPFDRGLVVLDDNSLVLPINRYLNYPSLDDYSQTVYKVSYRLEHQFSDSWRIRNSFLLSSFDGGGLSVNTAGELIDNQFTPREYYDDQFIIQNYGVQTDLIGKFKTGFVEHQLLLGFDFNRSTSFYQYRFAELPPNDIFNPVYDIPRPSVLSDTIVFSDRTDTWGIYLQDQVTLLKNLKLLIGGRFDFSTQKSLADPASEQSNDAFSPRVGIVYQPIEAISLYASYSTSFRPVIGLSANNSPFDPERGRQFEVGIKGEFLNNKLSATLAAFEITKNNVLTTDPDDSRFSIQVGEQRSRGIELDMIGEVLPGWNIIATYAYIDARVTEDNDIPSGNRLDNSAQHTASLWTTYEVQEGNLKGFGGGLGFFFAGNRPGDSLNTFELPSYFRTDATVFYKRDRWRLALNIKNLFNIEYYETAQNRNIVYPGAPFTVQGTISWQF